MTRTKFQRVPIVDEKARKLTLKKRTKSLFKKLEELSILCDVKVAAIVLDHSQDEDADKEVMWPSKEDFKEKLNRYLSTPGFQRIKKMTTHGDFLVKTLRAKAEKLKKLTKKNDEKEMLININEILEGKRRIQDLDLTQTERLLTYLKSAMKTLDIKTQNLMLPPYQRKQPTAQELETLSKISNIFFPLIKETQPAVLEMENCSNIIINNNNNNNNSMVFFLQQQNQFFGASSCHSTNVHPFQEELDEQFFPHHGFGFNSYHAALDPIPEPSATLLEDGAFFESLFEDDNLEEFGPAVAVEIFIPVEEAELERGIFHIEGWKVGLHGSKTEATHLALYVEVADEPVQDVGEGTTGGQYDGAGSSGVGGTNEDDDDTEDDVHGNSDEEYVPSDESDDDYSDHDASSVVISIFDDIVT
ncbi:OLC1v1037711C1 [Oldenlandia corymbosa var. corymbosa]|uniref:OLC1v1037711C1 n=1 Tax=Oldenlandia corymbosa var. corymbosa TaxID=529605 RepID=A0AAV1CYN4_OLDCO|nr:OLC1v1037711C1 [Oldenlandia corymbosa var. corymbosa]